MTDTAFTPLLHSLEERSFNALPAHQSVFYQGWVFRLTGGYTKRANSINALLPGAAFDGVLQAATAIYARQGLPAIFRLTPLAPPEADAALAQAGFVHCDPSLVMSMPLSAADNTPLPASITLSHRPSDAWIQGFANASAVPRHHRALSASVLHAIEQTCAFAVLHEEGQAVGYGLAVLERGAVGLYDIAISPSHRGLGRGHTLVNALLQWGAQAGASSAYLQVRAENTAALRLYEELGFQPVYAYHYRIPG